MSSLSKTPFSSISFTSGRTFSSANWRMLSRKRISSSVKLVSGVGEGSWRTSGIQAPSDEYGEPRILASLRGGETGVTSRAITGFSLPPRARRKSGLGVNFAAMRRVIIFTIILLISVIVVNGQEKSPKSRFRDTHAESYFHHRLGSIG